MLFFELFFSLQGNAAPRETILRELRQRVLPPPFIKHQVCNLLCKHLACQHYPPTPSPGLTIQSSPPSWSTLLHVDQPKPKEAALTLALLHPTPSSRPSVEGLLASEMFREAASALRQRGSLAGGGPAKGGPGQKDIESQVSRLQWVQSPLPYL